MALAPVLAMSATVPSGSPALKSAAKRPPVVRATARSGGCGRNSRPSVDWSPVNRSRRRRATPTMAHTHWPPSALLPRCPRRVTGQCVVVAISFSHQDQAVTADLSPSLKPLAVLVCTPTRSTASVERAASRPHFRSEPGGGCQCLAWRGTSTVRPTQYEVRGEPRIAENRHTALGSLRCRAERQSGPQQASRLSISTPEPDQRTWETLTSLQ